MEARLLDDRDSWNSWVEGCHTGNILQAYEWGEFKASFGWRVLRVGVLDGEHMRGTAQVLMRRTPAGTIAYCPRGPVIDYGDRKLTGEMLRAIHDVVRSEGASFLKIEPPVRDREAAGLGGAMQNLGLHQSEEFQPRSTIIVDLRPDLDTLLAKFNIKTRYNVGLARRHNVKIDAGSDGDVRTFYNLLQNTSERSSFMIHSEDYYWRVWQHLRPRGMAHLLLASIDGEVAAGTMIFLLGNRAYYMYGASSGKQRKHKPSDLLQWESIKWAKAAGCVSYDMWGIPDEIGKQACGNAGGQGENGAKLADRPESDNAANSPLWGVYLFKRGFGGEVVRYVGAYDYVYSPLHYWLWTKALPFQRHLFGKLKKIQPAKAS